MWSFVHQNSVIWHTTIYGKKIKFVIICLKMLSDSPLLTKSHSNSTVRVVCDSVATTLFNYLSSHISHIYLMNLKTFTYNSLSSKYPILLYLMPVLIFFFSWQYYFSLDHFLHPSIPPIIPFFLSGFWSSDPISSFKLVLFPSIFFNPPHSSISLMHVANLAWCWGYWSASIIETLGL